MNNFKPGDKVDWVTDFCDNGQFEWPGVVIGTYRCTAGTVAQFYIRKKGDAKGLMRVKEWLLCHLKPHQPKPRYKLVPVSALTEGDVFWCKGRHVEFTPSKWFMVYDPKYADKPCSYEGQTHVWKQTALQTHTSEQGGRRYADTVPISWWQPDDLSRIRSEAGLDEGAGGADTVPRKGDGGTADAVQSPAKPRATVCMTRSQNLKDGDFVAMRVVKMHASKTLALSLPSYGQLTIDPDRFYDKLNRVTK
jgi:hypothetical protein